MNGLERWRNRKTLMVRVPSQLLLAMAGCAALAVTDVSGAGPAADAATPSLPRVHAYEADARSYHVNAHWVESERGMVLIDTLLLKSDAERLVARMKATGKPLLAILITHPHVDHFSGSGVVRAHFGPVPVCATRATAEGMPRALAKANAQGWLKPLGGDHDADIVLPDCQLESGAEARFADMTFRVHDFGGMESENNSVFHLPAVGALFGGDALVAEAVYFVGDGRSRAALDGLDTIAKRFPADTKVYAGHYRPRQLGELVLDNSRQVERMREVMESARAEPGAVTASGTLTASARERAMRALVEVAGKRAGYGMDARAVAAMNMQGLMREWRESRGAVSVTSISVDSGGTGGKP